jgi:4'-phosphopantetheinyl transferase EntD
MAAVAMRREFAAIGLDCEAVGAATRDIWSTICRDEEMAWVRSLPEPEQPAAVTLMFCAKEAFYKCQYPLVREWLDFEDILIDARGWGGTKGSIAILATRPLMMADRVRLPVTGRYVRHGRFLSAGVCIASHEYAAQ